MKSIARTLAVSSARRLGGAVAVLAAGLVPSIVRAAEAGPLDYSRDVRPILSQTCFKCHGVDDKARKAKLRLDDRDAALQPAKSGERAIVPGKPDDSELVKRILSHDEEDVMPPASTKVTLTEQQKSILKRWVAEGAEYKPHWAFVAPKRETPPVVKQQGWARNPLDAFVLARLEKEGLHPSAEADRYTLARRLYLDLVGLPPTPAEADAFVADKSPDAYEKLVDRLLASPQYGERWARRWLDLARYADTNGYEKDRQRTIWPYRDWVINALNADMPFDQFTVEQLAGDMLPNATPAQKVATGFHRNTMRNEEGGIDPLEYRYYAMVDRVATTGVTWMGLTVGCAQCHTHKYDPLLHTEYFGLMAFLDNADEPEMDLPAPDLDRKKAEILAKMEALTAALPDKWPAEAITWEVATPANAKVSNLPGGKAKLESSADNSWRSNGDAPEKDTYTFTVDTDLPTVDRLKIDVLPDSPKVGPGRTPQGNFVLSDLTVSVGPKDGPATAVKIAKGSATFEQVNYPVSAAFDGDPKTTGWAIDGGKLHGPQAATFTLAEPVKAAKGMRFTVTLDQQYGMKHVIGRLRLSLGGETPDARPVAERRKTIVADKYRQWLDRMAPKAVDWKVLRPTTARSNAPTLTLKDDDSVLASGDITKADTYDLAFDNVNLKGVTAVRLEVLPDPSLPKNGPGMIYYEGPMGDFFLSNITLAADGKPAKFVKAAQSYAANNGNADRAIDADMQTGWSVQGGQGKPHVAVFALDKATDAKDLKLAMLFEKYYAAGLGRFRVSVTTDPKALAEPAAEPPAIDRALLTAEADRTADQQKLLYRRFLETAPELADAKKEIDALFRSIPEATTTLVLAERTDSNNRVTKLHHRGEWLQPEQEIKPGVPAFLPPLPAGQPANRLTFARWLVAPNNPLTARVAVNRQWQAFFGRGIVRTVEDFGFQGDLPTDQHLLDWLAVEFETPASAADKPWSMKRLHKLIVTSATYRQSAAATPELIARDPQNLLYARGPRFRAEAEIVRDAALKAAGLLSAKLGGPSVFPPQPASVTSEGAYGALAWTTSTGEDRYRRSLYTFTKRTAPFAMSTAFDAPTGEACIARRDLSNTPLQALTLLNDTVFVEAAQALGAKAAAAPGDDAAKVTFVFRQVLTREPSADEAQALEAFAAGQRKRFEAKELDAAKIAAGKPPEVKPVVTKAAAAKLKADAAKAKAAEKAKEAEAAKGKQPDAKSAEPSSPIDEEELVDRATWTTVARAVMNLDEAVTKD